jgi:hypothetical protein
MGAELRTDVQAVGEGIRLVTFSGPGGLVFGVIENPNFRGLRRQSGATEAGPGR